jgi:hypothetical protein
MRFRLASIYFISFEEGVVRVILVLARGSLCHGQRLIDRIDDVLVAGLGETTQDFTGFLWANAGYCFNRCQQ